MCTDDQCAGYRESPLSGDLWPGETEEEFGYPVGVSATREMSRQEKALLWLTKRIEEQRGAVQFGFIEDGNMGVWVGDEQGVRGIGDNALEVIESAIHGEQLLASRKT